MLLFTDANEIKEGCTNEKEGHIGAKIMNNQGNDEEREKLKTAKEANQTPEGNKFLDVLVKSSHLIRCTAHTIRPKRKCDTNETKERSGVIITSRLALAPVHTHD